MKDEPRKPDNLAEGLFREGKKDTSGGKEGRGGMLITIQEQSYTAFFCVIFFFMQKSCGQFVDVSDLNLVVCYLSQPITADT